MVEQVEKRGNPAGIPFIFRFPLPRAPTENDPDRPRPSFCWKTTSVAQSFSATVDVVFPYILARPPRDYNNIPKFGVSLFRGRMVPPRRGEIETRDSSGVKRQKRAKFVIVAATAVFPQYEKENFFDLNKNGPDRKGDAKAQRRQLGLSQRVLEEGKSLNLAFPHFGFLWKYL